MFKLNILMVVKTHNFKYCDYQIERKIKYEARSDFNHLNPITK